MAAAAPTHRVRGKSAPRGRSPNPKELKKAAKGLTTPPPNTKKRQAESSGSSKGVARQLSFGKSSTVDIVAENPAGPHKAGDSSMNLAKADKIFDTISKEPLGSKEFDTLCWKPKYSFVFIFINIYIYNI